MAIQLSLFVSGDGAGTRRTAMAIRDWCDRHLGGRYRLEVIDVGRWPDRAAAAQVLATPTLAVSATLARVAGDLTDIPGVMAGLGLAPATRDPGQAGS